MKKSFKLIILIIALMPYGLGKELDHASKMAASQKLFSDEIRGVLIDRCVKCHGGKKTRSEFNLVTRKGLLSGGDQGAAVIVGEPDKSPIIKYLRHTEEPFMPPKESILPETSISKIEEWIALGAAYDKPLLENIANQNDGPMKVTDEDKSYWAFAPLKTDFQGNKIDDFVKIIDYETRARVFDKLFFQVDYPKEMEEVINKHNNHTRNVNLIKFNINDFELKNYKELNISENNNEIIDYYNKNINSYIDPEKRNISYVVINKDDYKNEFIPSESQILNYYNDNQNLFLNPEKRDFIQFNFKSLEEADEFKKNISTLNNENIVKFAKENNVFFNEFSNVSQNEVLEELSNVIFRLEENVVSEVVETVIAKHIVIVSKIYPEFQKNIDESKEEISKTLLEVELDSYLLDLKNKINQQILDGSP